MENNRNNNERYNNNFNLIEASKINELEGYNINNIPKKIELNIKRSPLRVEVLKSERGSDLKYELFKRLNTGGLSLTDQEMRNAIFRPQLKVFFDYIDNKLDDLLFPELSISDNKKKKYFHHEMFLRILSLYYEEGWKQINTNISDHIDNFCKILFSLEDKDKDKIQEDLIKVFEENYNKLKKLNNSEIFKGRNGSFSPTIFEAVVLMTIIHNEVELMTKIQELKESEDFIQKGVDCQIKM